MGTVVGREPELAAVSAFLADVHDGGAVLSIEGDAGVGKTTIWLEALELAAEAGFRVLRCRPAHSEAKLAFASLADLFAEIGDDTLARLPAPQLAALEVALLRARPNDQLADSRTVATALLTTLAELAKDGPTLVAIDDVQWVDTASAAVLEFALRRLGPTRVGVLTAWRRTEPSELRPALLLDSPRARVLTIGPLSLGEIHHVLKQHLDWSPSRPLLVRIHRSARGNPLFALEIGRLLSRRETTPPIDEPLPVPSDVESLILDRVSMLPKRTYDVLLAAACVSSAGRDLLRKVVGDFGAADLAPARKAGIATFEGGVVGFAHPLYASAVYASASTRERRSLHSRIAEVLQEPAERARHLALAAEGRDETVAAAVHEAARDAARRGSPAAAAELTQLALDLGNSDRVTGLVRIVDLATYLRRAGDNERARQLLEGVESWAGSTSLHADALELLIEIEFWTNGPSDEFERIVAPLLDAATPVDVRARLHASLARYSNHDIARSATHAERALALLDELGDDAPPETRATALADLVRCRLLLGDGLDRAAVARVLELETAIGSTTGRRPPSESFGFCLRYADDLEGSRALLTQRAREDLETGHESGALNALQHLAVTECLAGNFTLALDYARQACDLHDRQEQSVLGYAPAILALVQAHRGEHDEVYAVTERYDAFSQGHNTYLRSALGLLELSLADHSAALEHCLHVIGTAEGFGVREPGVYRVHANAAEAAVAVGDLAQAEALVSYLVRHASRTNHRWSRAAGLRAHALALAARGDLDAAVAASEEAVAAHDGLAMPFEHARTVLVRGQVLRRHGDRGAARDAFHHAIGQFEEMGTRLWVERAREELGRIPIRRSSGDALTPAERRVAELVAQGKTNEEVAQALFVSKKTVEANLTRIYRKLGVRSRVALSARMSAGNAREEQAEL